MVHAAGRSRRHLPRTGCRPIVDDGCGDEQGQNLPYVPEEAAPSRGDRGFPGTGGEAAPFESRRRRIQEEQEVDDPPERVRPDGLPAEVVDRIGRIQREHGLARKLRRDGSRPHLVGESARPVARIRLP